MELKIGDVILNLPPLWMAIIIIISIFIIIRWSKQLETNRSTVFFYFLISTVITPLSIRNIVVWIPIGFIAICLYLYGSKRYHASKMKASLVGLFFALYQIISKFIG